MTNSFKHSVPLLRVAATLFLGAFIAIGCDGGTGIIPIDDGGSGGGGSGGGGGGGGGTTSTLSVSISGKSSVDIHEYDTYVASVSDGSGSYSYKWQQSFDGGSYTSSSFGSNDSVYWAPHSCFNYIDLKVTVRDDSNGDTATDVHRIYVNC
jgi:hypothetical protein